MHAIVHVRYGRPDLLELREVPDPTPGDDDVLIATKAVSLNRSDWEVLTGTPLYSRSGGLRRPGGQKLGTDIAGTVVAVGKDVTAFRPGDEVFGDVMYHHATGFAELICVPETAPIVHKPAGLSFQEVSTLPQAGLIALQGTDGHVGPDKKVLINGAGGGAGTFAIQLAKAAGATVTGVDNALKQEHMRGVGADHVLDYEQVDFTKTGGRYDLILDLVATRLALEVHRAVAPGGRYAAVGGRVSSLLSVFLIGRMFSSENRHIGMLIVRPNKEDMTRASRMALDRTLRPVIERSYTLDDVSEALLHLGEDRALGKLVIEFP